MKIWVFDIDTRILQVASYFVAGMFIALLYIYSGDLKNAIL